MKHTLKTMLGRHPWLILAAVAGVALSFAVMHLRGEPMGKFASYKMFPHDHADVLVFSNGTVRSLTCCGDSDWGTYARTTDGRWLWTMIHGTKKPVTNTLLIEPGALSVTITATQSPPTSFTLRRRLFTKMPL